MMCHIGNDLFKRQEWSPAQNFLDLGDIRDAPLHILKAWVICDVVRDFGDRALRLGDLDDALR